jgi:small subunit ribosomal protein S18
MQSNIPTQDGYISNLLLFNKTAEVAQKKPVCHLAKNQHLIHYTNVELLKQYITKGRGRIIPRRITGLPSHIHKKLVREIKIARILALLPFASGM